MKRLWMVGLGAGVLLAVNPVLAQSAPPSPGDFAVAAAQSDAYEIAAARVAPVEAQNLGVRAFAKQMLDDHVMTTQTLKAAAAKSGQPPLPETPNPDQARLCYMPCNA